MAATINIKYNIQYAYHNASYDFGRQCVSSPLCSCYICSFLQVQEPLGPSTPTQGIYPIAASHHARP